MAPAHVSMIHEDYVHLKGNTLNIESIISKSQYRGRSLKDRSGLKLRFIPSEEIFEKNDLLELLKWLNSYGVLFSTDRGWGPSELMQEFQNRGLLKETFDEIAWKGPSDWVINKINPMTKPR
ncbi:MAG: hypothetical protein JNM55_17485 [Anaerolineales bacterium]|nr:hypothetical protein [Anaerolineales bacterium]